jgi:hypothetical protein
MSGVYIIVSVNNHLDIEVEAHAGFEGAKQRALELAKEKSAIPSWICSDPKEEKLDVGCKWVFLNTSKTCVFVVYQPIQVPDYTKTVPCQLYMDADGAVSGINPMPKDDPEDRNLPGGWDYNNIPITMALLTDDPYAVKAYNDLTTQQIRALVFARIKKRPNFSILIPGYGTFVQNSALKELEKNSVIGEQIIDAEINFLNDFLANHM